MPFLRLHVSYFEDELVVARNQIYQIDWKRFRQSFLRHFKGQTVRMELLLFIDFAFKAPIPNRLLHTAHGHAPER